MHFPRIPFLNYLRAIAKHVEDPDLHKKVPSPDIFETLSKEEQEAVLALDSIKEFPKGNILIKEHQVPTNSFFVVSGLIRKFRINEAGEDITLEFYTDKEDVFSTSLPSNPRPSTFSLECLEDSRISVTSFKLQEEMYRRFPRFERMCRESSELSLIAYQEKFANYISRSPEERYLDILKNRADLLERVPQYQLASYLGVKPESLSRIRKRIADKS